MISAPRFVRFAITGSLPGSQCAQGMRGQVSSVTVQMRQKGLRKTPRPKPHGLSVCHRHIFAREFKWPVFGVHSALIGTDPRKTRLGCRGNHPSFSLASRQPRQKSGRHHIDTFEPWFHGDVNIQRLGSNEQKWRFNGASWHHHDGGSGQTLATLQWPQCVEGLGI